MVDIEEERRFSRDEGLNPEDDPELKNTKLGKVNFVPFVKEEETKNEEKEKEKEKEGENNENNEEKPKSPEIDVISPEKEKERLEKEAILTQMQNKQLNSLKDVNNAIKLELKSLKECVKVLKNYGIDWILEWIKTKNFKYWLKTHNEFIADRSVNNPYCKNHFWFSENGNIYFGELSYGKRHGN